MLQLAKKTKKILKLVLGRAPLEKERLGPLKVLEMIMIRLMRRK